MTSNPRWAGKPGETRYPDYRFVRLEGYITSPTSEPNSKQTPLYSWWNPTHGDNFITNNPGWVGKIGNNKNGYTLFRLEGYVDNGPAGRDQTIFIVPPRGTLGQPNSGNGLWGKSDGAAQPKWLDGNPSGLSISVRSESVNNSSISVWVRNP